MSRGDGSIRGSGRASGPGGLGGTTLLAYWNAVDLVIVDRQMCVLANSVGEHVVRAAVRRNLSAAHLNRFLVRIVRSFHGKTEATVM